MGNVNYCLTVWPHLVIVGPQCFPLWLQLRFPPCHPIEQEDLISETEVLKIRIPLSLYPW